jgi:hypothetical protein
MSSTLSFSLLATCGTPPLSYWLLGLAWSRPHSPLVQQRFLPWLTDSYISYRFHAHGLLIALMMEAARTSETLVNFYQTTQRYNPEDSHLRTHHHENLKSYLTLFLFVSVVSTQIFKHFQIIYYVQLYEWLCWWFWYCIIFIYLILSIFTSYQLLYQCIGEFVHYSLFTFSLNKLTYLHKQEPDTGHSIAALLNSLGLP